MSYIGRQPTAAALTASDITDGIVSNAKLAQDIISADTALGAAPADTDELLVSDAGTLKRMDYSYIKAANTPAFQAYLSSNQTITEVVDVKLACDTELYDTDSAYDNSSNYRFTPQTAGKYMVYACATFTTSTDDNMRSVSLMVHKNGSRVDFFGTSYRNNHIRNAQVYGSVIVDFNGSSDYVEIYSFGNTGDDADPDIVGGSNDKAFFGAYKLIT